MHTHCQFPIKPFKINLVLYRGVLGAADFEYELKISISEAAKSIWRRRAQNLLKKSGNFFLKNF